MPQVDLETLVSVCGAGSNDRKIACETLADGDQRLDEPDQPEVPPDFPPESFWLSKDAEFDWFDRNAFFERKASTKGNSNSSYLNPPNSNSSSQRFSMNLKPKASIIGLPKTQKATYVDAKRKPANIRLFPKRTESVGKSAMVEPSSPKVSCMGRVRSKRGCRRPRSSESSGTTQTKTTTKTKTKTTLAMTVPLEKARSNSRHRKTGLFTGIISVFRSRRRSKAQVERSHEPADSPSNRGVAVKMRDVPVSVEPVMEPPGLAGMMRFASGRRSESWGVDDLDQKIDVRVSISEPSDRD